MGKNPTFSCLLVPPQQGSQVLWRAVRHKVLHILAPGGLPMCLNINQLDHMLLPAAVTHRALHQSPLSRGDTPPHRAGWQVLHNSHCSHDPCSSLWQDKITASHRQYPKPQTDQSNISGPDKTFTKSLSRLDGTSIIDSSSSQLFHHFTSRFIPMSIHLLGGWMVVVGVHSLVINKG